MEKNQMKSFLVRVSILLFLGLLIIGSLNLGAGLQDVKQSDSQAGEYIRIMSFNILEGGQGAGRNDEWLDPIKEQNPDIIVLNEAAYWESKDLLSHYVNILNEYHWPEEQNYSGRVTTGGGSPAIAVLSRFNFTNFETLLLGTDNRVFAHATFEIYSERVHIFGVHLKSGAQAYDRNARESQTNALLDEIRVLPKSDSIFIMGDFNSYSIVDCEDPDINPNWNYSATWSQEQAGTYASEALLENGFIDTFREKNPKEPGWTCFDTHPDANYTAFGRIDYQYVSENKLHEIINSSRIYDPVRSPTWSDHVPLLGVYWIGSEMPSSSTTTSTTTIVTTTTNETTSNSITESSKPKISPSFGIIFALSGVILLQKRKRRNV
ncbi:MAG: endonuclease/exonuclease/phosphatase family protein [Candidatus Hodarchaeales archaeon]